MRALLIDPKERSVTEVQNNGALSDTTRLLECETPTNLGWLAEGDTLWIDDEGMRKNPRHFFTVRGGCQIAGKGLVIGIDAEGNDCDAAITVADLLPQLKFLRGELQGFHTTSTPDSISIKPVISCTPDAYADWKTH